MPVIVNCAICGKEIERYPYHLKKRDHHCCSRECDAKWRSEHMRGERAAGWKGGKIEVPCANCGKTLSLFPSDTKNREHNFCNKACAYEWRSRNLVGPKAARWDGGPVQVQCAECGATLERCAWKAKIYHRHFCNYECRARWLSRNKSGPNHHQYRGIKVRCATCGRGIIRKPYHLAHFKHFYCSQECKSKWRSQHWRGENHPAWQGGHPSYYGPNWLEQRRLARRRDGGKCQHCGVTEKKLGRKLDVHHIKPFREFDYVPGENENYKQANQLSNLISLCPSCHQNAEHGNIPVQPKLL